MADVVDPSTRVGTTASVASSFEPVHTKPKEKVKAKPKQTNDPLKVLDPAKKKLTSVESQRVLAALDETIRRVEVVTLLPFITENLDRFSVILGTELTRLLQEHDSLQNTYRKLLSKYELEQKRVRSSSPQGQQTTSSSSRRSSQNSEELASELQQSHRSSRQSSIGSAIGITKRIKSLSLDDESAVDLSRIENLGHLVQQSTRTVLRLFSLNPTAVNAIRKEKNERSFEANTLIDEMAALRAMCFERLLTTPTEVSDRKTYLTAVMEREKKSTVLANKLQVELQNAIDDRDNEISKRNDMIRHLKNDIYNIDTNSEEMNRRIINEASKQEQADMKNSDGKKAKLQQELIELKKRLEAERGAHRESELALRKRKYKIETEVENWIQKFDTDMGERQDEFDALDAVYTEEKKQLQELEERFKTLEKEYTTIVEERRIAKEKAEAAERELNMKIRAARLIQAMWRAHKARKLLQKKKKKGKKGKKGKKSGKKR